MQHKHTPTNTHSLILLPLTSINTFLLQINHHGYSNVIIAALEGGSDWWFLQGHLEIITEEKKWRLPFIRQHNEHLNVSLIQRAGWSAENRARRRECQEITVGCQCVWVSECSHNHIMFSLVSEAAFQAGLDWKVARFNLSVIYKPITSWSCHLVECFTQLWYEPVCWAGIENQGQFQLFCVDLKLR